MEENRRFSWTNLFIKIILVVIFVIFTIWLLSLSTKDMSNSLDVLTQNVFSENIEKMKEVGREYFTLKRLPSKVGEIKTISLKEMYEKKLLLELTDKDGKACSADNSYVSIEKLDDEYQMKVYLECGNKSDYIIVIMGCYDYCDTDICEVKKEEVNIKEIEYQYKKTTGGKWSNYGKWSDWSKVSVTNTDNRQVETKKEIEKYTYDKNVVKTEKVAINATCPSGYIINGDKCVKVNSSVDTTNPVCLDKSGYTLIGRNGFTCNYSKVSTNLVTGSAYCLNGFDKKGDECFKSDTYTATSQAFCLAGYERQGDKCVKTVTDTTTRDAVCPTGYTKSGTSCVKTVTDTITKDAVCPTGYTKSGNTCVNSTSSTKEPSCPTKDGYTFIGRNGFVCSYSKLDITDTKNPMCPTKDGYIMYSRDGFTCNYKKTIKGEYVETKTGSEIPANTDKYYYERVGAAEYVYACLEECGMQWVNTYKVYKATVAKTTADASCPIDYIKSGDECISTRTDRQILEATCPTGYTQSGGSCVKTTSTQENPTCPVVTGYTNTGRNGFTCNYSKNTTDTKSLMCPQLSGYRHTGREGLVCNYTKTTIEEDTPYCSGKAGYISAGRTGFTCKYTQTITSSNAPICPTKTGYTLVSKNGFVCTYSQNAVNITSSQAVCPVGYIASAGECVKVNSNILYKDLEKSCPSGYELTKDGKECYKEVTTTEKVTEDKEVTYYRYRIREYVGGTVDYKWSSSKNDKELLNAGYKLTGKTR